jgi:hypothetical protein
MGYTEYEELAQAAWAAAPTAGDRIPTLSKAPPGHEPAGAIR